MFRIYNGSFGPSADAFLACLLVAAFGNVPVMAQEKVLHVFQGGSDGEYPQSSLIADAGGNLYGTSRGGGVGFGTVFGVAAHDSESVLYAFKGGSDGANPAAGLIEDSAGNFYGTTEFGGTCNVGNLGCGTAFKIAPGGSESVLYTFQDGGDGGFPEAALIQDGAGNLYGTANGGGSSGFGTVFEIGAGGGETVLHAFGGGTDGSGPAGGVIRDGSGNLYGTTVLGGGGTGCDDDDYGCGTVFKIAPDGTESVLHAFQGGSDGALPEATLIQDAAGNLYGTTNGGGPNDLGTVFELSPTGAETALYTFKGGSDGEYPQSALIADASGNLYGTTTNGGGTACGNSGCGTVFELTAKGREKVLYAFRATHGRNPYAGLLMGPHHELYGTTFMGGGKLEKGVIFKLKS